MQFITLDFETYYDSAYSLRQMTTEEYIRDPRFEIIMVSVKVDGGQTQVFSGDLASTRNFLQWFDLPNKAVCSHNAMFDMAILQWIVGIKPGFIFDTLSMARGSVGFSTGLSLKTLAEFFNCKSRKGDAVSNMGGRRRESLTPAELKYYSDYCCNDTDLCFELWQKLYPLTLHSECELIDWTIRAFTEPKLVLDEPLLTRELQLFRERSRFLLSACGVTDVGELRSDDRMASLLMQVGAVPPTKLNAKGQTRWAFSKQDVEFMDMLEDPDERVSALVEARLGLKTSIVESRILRFLSISRRGAMPVPLQYCGAMANKRWSGTDNINLQNLPRNKIDKATGATIKSPLRSAIRAPAGKKLMVADLSQIEARLNCWHSGQADMLNLFATGGDPYADQASVIYGETITKAMGKSTHTVQRFVGKVAVLGCGYQCGPPKFQHMLKIDARKYQIILPDESLEFAQKVVGAYRKKNYHIVNFWAMCEAAIPHLAQGSTFQLGPYVIAKHRVWLPNGTSLYYPDLKRTTNPDTGQNEWTYLRMRGRAAQRATLYGGKLDENITSAVGRIIMSDAMLRIKKVIDVVGTVHDELIMLFNDGADELQLTKFVTEQMTMTPTWAPGIPLACEVSTGYSYADAK